MRRAYDARETVCGRGVERSAYGSRPQPPHCPDRQRELGPSLRDEDASFRQILSKLQEASYRGLLLRADRRMPHTAPRAGPLAPIGGPPGPLSIAPTPRRRARTFDVGAGTFDVGGGPTGAAHRYPSAPCPSPGPPTRRSARRASAKEVTPLLVHRHSRGR